MTAQQLKNSILQMAVQGKLVPQDPADEPASVLLDRIREEKERLIKEGKIKREKNPSVIFRGADNLPYEKCGGEVRCIADEVPFDIPDTWEWVRLKQVGTTELGKTLDKAKNKGEFRPYLCSINVYWNGIDLTNVKEARFEDTELSKYLLHKGDLLICEGGDVGRSAIWDGDSPMYYQNALHRVRFCGDIEPHYFLLLLEAYKGLGILDCYSKGMTIKHLVQTALLSICFPLPPLPEQHRIVEAVDELRPALEAYSAKESELRSLNTAFPSQLKKSILQMAVQGKLVPQDPADEPASILLERIREEKARLVKEGKIKKDKHESVIFRRDNSHYEKRDDVEVCIDEELPFEIPESWSWTRLSAICETIFDIDHNMPKSVEPSVGILFISAKDLFDNGTLNFSENVKYISKEDFNRLSKKGVPQKGDIIYSRIGACLGKARIVASDIQFLASYSCCTIRPLLIYTPYIQMLMDGGFVLQQAKESTQSIGVPDLGMQMIKDFLLPIPPYDEQKKITVALRNAYSLLQS